MFVTDRVDLAEKVRLLRSHGMTSLTWDRHQGHAYSYDVVDLGYNYRIDELHSALGLAQLAKLRANNARRKALTRQYWQALRESEFTLPFCNWDGLPGVEPAYHIFPALLPAGSDRTLFIDRLRSAGVQTSIHYPPIHQFSYYRQRFTPEKLPVTEQAAEREVTLPLYPGMEAEEQAIVIQAALQAARA